PHFALSLHDALPIFGKASTLTWPIVRVPPRSAKPPTISPASCSGRRPDVRASLGRRPRAPSSSTPALDGKRREAQRVRDRPRDRSEEHTSELQSRVD